MHKGKKRAKTSNKIKLLKNNKTLNSITNAEITRKIENSFAKNPPSTTSICFIRSVRNNIIITGLICTIFNYCYYGSIFAINALKGSIYFNSTLSTIADIIGSICIGCSLNNFKRKKVIIYSFSVIIIASFSLYFIEIPTNC